MCLAHSMRQSAHARAHASAEPEVAPCPACSAANNRFRPATLAAVAPMASNALRRLSNEVDVFMDGLRLERVLARLLRSDFGVRDRSRAGLGHFLILLRALRAADADCADDLTVVNDRHATLQRCEVRQSRHR